MLQQMAAVDSRPSWDVAQLSAVSDGTSVSQAGRQEAWTDEHALLTETQQRHDAVESAVHCHTTSQPAAAPRGMMESSASGVLCVSESTVVQQAVLAMQVRQQSRTTATAFLAHVPCSAAWDGSKQRASV